MKSSTTKRKRKRQQSAKASARLENAKFLKLAAKHRPPQTWYDDDTDPTKPEASKGS